MISGDLDLHTQPFFMSAVRALPLSLFPQCYSSSTHHSLLFPLWSFFFYPPILSHVYHSSSTLLISWLILTFLFIPRPSLKQRWNSSLSVPAVSHYVALVAGFLTAFPSVFSNLHPRPCIISFSFNITRPSCIRMFSTLHNNSEFDNPTFYGFLCMDY